MKESQRTFTDLSRNARLTIISLLVATFLVYYFSNPKPSNFYDYTFRVAGNLLGGEIGFKEQQPSWLNEFVPYENNWYSVFPLGSVLSMVPFALLKTIGFIQDMPAAFISALLASLVCLFLFLTASRYEIERRKVVLTTLSILFGTWMWTNLTFAGAWQLALGFAMVGEIGAIYFTVYNRRPLLAGAFFALAFGNRTEILLTAPIFMFLLSRDSKIQNQNEEIESDENTVKKKTVSKNTREAAGNENSQSGISAVKSEIENLRGKITVDPQYFVRRLAAFCVVPFFLGIATLFYNYARFHSFTDFGYARIPGVLDEPWYNHGIFSVWYIPRQAYEMLLKLWETKNVFPYYVPNGFSNSILLTSPFLFLLLRFGSRDAVLKYTSWAAIFILTFLLWMHGNSGGWQFGYRYAMVLLPWIFVILLENSPKKTTPLEWLLYVFSIVANAYATYLFHWTEYVKP